MTGLQLLHSGGKQTMVLGLSGLLAGLLYRLNVLGIKRLKVWVPNTCLNVVNCRSK